ncbi:MAG: hypothetical protein LBT33_09425 [Spirochaetia bacterium]|jgi:hypothetical protein|nr:hypothetical protein [Spirochaetia bacterium]
MISKQKNIKNLFQILLLGFSLGGCASVPTLGVREDVPLVLAQAVPLRDLAQPGMEDMDAYEKNLFLGTIAFSGGIIQDRQKGNIFRALSIELSGEDYLARVSRVIQSSLGNALKSEDVSVVEKTAFPVPAEAAPLFALEAGFTDGYESGYEKRTDNINFPVWDYTLSVVSPRDLSALIQKNTGVGAGILVVPVIECAYSHTGGWFYDRESGSPAGVRVIVQIIGIDIAAGDIVYRYKQDYKHIVKPYQSAISTYAVDGLLKEFAGQLRDGFARTIR